LGRYALQPASYSDTTLLSHSLSQCIKLFFEPNIFLHKYPNISQPTLCKPTCLWRWNRQSVLKRRHIKFRRRGIIQRKAFNISTFDYISVSAQMQLQNAMWLRWTCLLCGLSCRSATISILEFRVRTGIRSCKFVSSVFLLCWLRSLRWDSYSF